jgi:hypothetical protein
MLTGHIILTNIGKNCGKITEGWENMAYADGTLSASIAQAASASSFTQIVASRGCIAYNSD